MKNLKKQLAAATAVAALAAVPALAGAPAPQQPGANVGLVLSLTFGSKPAKNVPPRQRRIAGNPLLMMTVGAFFGSREGGVVGGFVGAA